jgi:serine/threonine protein phosphatase PrpC
LFRTEIHNATNADEVGRLTSNKAVKFTDDEKKGEHFTYNKKEFQLSRAFGFQPRLIQECAPEPDTYTLEDNHDFAIIMSDGLENAGLQKAYNDLPEFAKPNYKENNLHASFIHNLISILISEKTENCIKDKVREEFNSCDMDDKSMVFIPIHKL